MITLIPPKVSVKRPLTSAFIFPLALKIGRIYLNDFKAIKPNIDKGTKVKSVIQTFILNKITNVKIAVNEPPINCTKPVPIKFLTPSTSLIILETNAPDFVLSKKLMGKDNTFFCTCALNSDIKYCA